MKKNPNDKIGWLRLERAYRVMGETTLANEAAAQAAPPGTTLWRDCGEIIRDRAEIVPRSCRDWASLPGPTKGPRPSHRAPVHFG